MSNIVCLRFMRSGNKPLREVPCGTQHRFFHSTTTLKKEKSLPVLKTLVRAAKGKIDFSDTAILGVQHLLGSTVSLIKSLLALGVHPSHIHLIGKPYSTASVAVSRLRSLGVRVYPDAQLIRIGSYEKENRLAILHMLEQATRDLRRKQVKRVILLDEGFKLVENLPFSAGLDYTMGAIEQTRAGLYSESFDHSLFPVVEVASSVVKRLVEPPMIAKAVIKKVQSVMAEQALKKGDVCGVVGYGAVGCAVVHYLLSQEMKVIVYDQNDAVFANVVNKNLYRVDSLKMVVANVKYLFGCTGRDISKAVDFHGMIKKDCVLVSCSSGISEYATLLRRIDFEQNVMVNPVGDVVFYSNVGSKITIVRGGFPVNFDNSEHSVPPRDIQVTRRLLLVACMQALTVAQEAASIHLKVNAPRRIMLDPYLQQLVMSSWVYSSACVRDYPDGFFKQFQDTAWICKNSGGDFDENAVLKEIAASQRKQSLVF